MPYRPTERTEARKAATRDSIIEAAMDQLAEGGYASASVQAVAARAGVATGTVYRYFPSKSELFAEVFRIASGREIATLAELADRDGSAVDRIEAAVETFARRALASPTRAWALIAEPVDPAVEAERLVFRRDYRDTFAAVLDEGVAAGEIEPHDSRTLAAALVGAIGETLVGPLAEHEKSDALVASIVRFCVSAIPVKERARAAA